MSLKQQKPCTWRAVAATDGCYGNEIMQPDKTRAARLNLDSCKLVQVQIPDTQCTDYRPYSVNSLRYLQMWKYTVLGRESQHNRGVRLLSEFRLHTKHLS